MPLRTQLPLVVLAAALHLAAAGPLTDAESRGKRIYTQGTGESGRPIQATIADGGADVSAAVLSCSTCHGRDGRGREESGVVPSDLRWEILSKPYKLTLPGGRSRQPYDDAHLIRAITLGIDSSGQDLNRAMPRFRLSRQDAADLVAYLKRLGAATDPGIDSAHLRIGMILPPDSDFASAAAIRAATHAYFDRLNRSGGIYGRQIDLRTAPTPDGAAGLTESMRRFVDADGLFALVNTYIAGAERDAASYTNSAEVPMIGALTLYPATEFPLNPYIFYLDGGVPSQVEALAAYPTGPAASIALVFADAEPWRGVAQAVMRRHPELQWSAKPVEIQRARQFQPSLLVEQLKREASAYTLVLLPPRLSGAFWKAAAALKSWNTALLVPSDLASPQTFDLLAADSRAIFALSATPSDILPEAAGDYQNLARDYHLPHDHLAAQWTALAACRILQEGLVRSGHELTRARLVEMLEALYRFPTGFAITVTYGPNLRVGDSESHLVSFNPASGALTPVRP